MEGELSFIFFYLDGKPSFLYRFKGFSWFHIKFLKILCSISEYPSSPLFSLSIFRPFRNFANNNGFLASIWHEEDFLTIFSSFCLLANFVPCDLCNYCILFFFFKESLKCIHIHSRYHSFSTVYGFSPGSRPASDTGVQVERGQMAVVVLTSQLERKTTREMSRRCIMLKFREQ